MKHTIKEIVKDNTAKLDYVCEGILYFNIEVEDSVYRLEINSLEDDWKGVYIQSVYKIMRWIRKYYDTEKFLQIK
jgi:hypothetical protein